MNKLISFTVFDKEKGIGADITYVMGNKIIHRHTEILTRRDLGG